MYYYDKGGCSCYGCCCCCCCCCCRCCRPWRDPNIMWCDLNGTGTTTLDNYTELDNKATSGQVFTSTGEGAQWVEVPESYWDTFDHEVRM